MAFIHKGTLEIERGFGLPKLNTVFRLAYVPVSGGYVVWDTDHNSAYVWDGIKWNKLSSDEGLDDSLAQNQALTTTRLINLNGNTLGFLGTTGGFAGITNAGNIQINSNTTTPFTGVRTSSGQFISLQDGTDDFGIYNNAGNPEGVVIANTGSLCIDTSNGKLYIKTSDTFNTGWETLGAATEPEDHHSGLKTVNEPLNIRGSVTNPTKATNTEADYINLVDDGSGWVTVDFKYKANSNVGANAGSGYYIFDLPTGYAFDVSVHEIETSSNVNGIYGWDNQAKVIGGSSVLVGYETVYPRLSHVWVESATSFKIGTNVDSNSLIKSSHFAISNNYVYYGGTFRFKKQL